MTHNPLFRVGDVFGDDAPSAALIRLLVIVRQLHSFLNAYLRIDPSESTAHRERFYFAVSGSLGAAKEAADAFRDADSNGSFRSIDTDRGDPAMLTQLCKLRQDCDRSATESVYSRILKDVRDNAAWHWNRERIAKVIGEIRNESVSMYDGSGKPDDTGIPIVSLIVASVMLLDQVPMSKIPQQMQEVVAFYGRLVEVTHHAYYNWVRGATPGT